MTVEKPALHHFNRLIKFNTTSIGTNQHHEPPEKMHQEGHRITSVIFLCKMGNLNLIMTKEAPIHKVIGLYFSKKAEVMKDKGTVSDERTLKRHDSGIPHVILFLL